MLCRRHYWALTQARPYPMDVARSKHPEPWHSTSWSCTSRELDYINLGIEMHKQCQWRTWAHIIGSRRINLPCHLEFINIHHRLPQTMNKHQTQALSGRIGELDENTILPLEDPSGWASNSCPNRPAQNAETGFQDSWYQFLELWYQLLHHKILALGIECAYSSYR